MNASKSLRQFASCIVREFHYRRFYPEDGASPIADMGELFQIIRCESDQPRISVPDPANPQHENRRFDVVERASADIIKVGRFASGSRTKLTTRFHN
jgi:hypothetical protein